MRKLRYIAFILLTRVAAAFAADVQMTVEPNMISLLDRAVLKIEFINTDGEAAPIPQVEGLQIQYQGPSTETRMINWKTTSKTVHSYVITPTKVGEFTIGPVVCKYKGGSKTLSAQLKVIKPSEDKEAQEISEMLFSKISSERTDPYVHEPFALDVYVHIRSDIQTDGRISLRGGMPENGINGEPSWEMIDQQRKEINGAIFTVQHLRATVKTLTAGTFTFQPQVQLNIIIPRQNRRGYGQIDPFFGDFFGRQEVRPIVLDCNSLDIEVKPIPTQNRPGSYSGGIGRYDFDVEVGPKAVKAGEPITVKMRIWGDGNTQQITPPAIEANGDLKLYEARTLSTDNPGEVRFEQVIIPKSGDITEIPAISFTYFNTQTSDFRTITKGPFPITVEAAPADQIAQVIATIPSTITPKETRILGRDIIYLKPMPGKWETHSTKTNLSPKLLCLLIGSPALLLLLIMLFTARRDSLIGNVAKARRQKAPKSARKNIQLAEHALHKKNIPAFYEALWNALADYFGNRLNLAPGEISSTVVLRRLPDNRKEDAEAIRKVFDQIDRLRYGSDGSGATDEMKAILKDVNRILKKCERLKL